MASTKQEWGFYRYIMGRRMGYRCYMVPIGPGSALLAGGNNFTYDTSHMGR